MKKLPYLLALILCCPNFVLSQTISPSADVSYPAVGLWNGFLEHLNVLECSNYGAQPVSIEIDFRFSSGVPHSNDPSLTIGAYDTKHLVLNELSEFFADNHGSYQISIDANSIGDGSNLRCLTAVYRLSKGNNGKMVDYAFAWPVQNAQLGETAGIYNSINPDGLSDPVFNWLSLYNPGSNDFFGNLEVYDQSGDLIETLRLSAAPGGRLDIPLGHPRTQAGGQVTGVYKIIPDEPTSPYGAFLTRYGQRDGEYYFAFPILSVKPGCSGEPVAASTMNPAINWAEIASLSSATEQVDFELKNSSGTLVHSESFLLQSNSQKNILINPYFFGADTGQFTASCNSSSSKLIVQSLYYGRLSDIADVTAWAYVSQLRGLAATPGYKLATPVNTFLGASNWLKMFKNPTAQGRSAKIALEHLYPSPAVVSDSTSEQGGSIPDVFLNQFFDTDTIGATVASARDSSAPLNGEVIRVFPHDSGAIGYIFSIPAAVVPGEVPGFDLEQIVPAGITRPVYLSHAGDSSSRLFIVSQAGEVLIYKDGVVLTNPFLDIKNLVSFGGEQGLLSIAFHPDYLDKGLFYVNYSNLDGDTIIAEYSRDAGNIDLADPSSERIILKVPQPFANHNGGQLQFGPDGYLYIGLGDGGGAGDPEGNSQNLGSLKGAMLRIDIDNPEPAAGREYSSPADNPFLTTPGAAPEIYAYGFRNPWRFSFDRLTGQLLLGDVGQDELEEIDEVVAGGNYGWKTMEGSNCFSPATNCDTNDLALPIFQYGHDIGVAVVGGYTYRGLNNNSMYGKYLLGDFSSGEIFVLEESSSGVWIERNMTKLEMLISSFGEDEDGELYVISLDAGIWKLLPED